MTKKEIRILVQHKHVCWSEVKSVPFALDYTSMGVLPLDGTTKQGRILKLYLACMIIIPFGMKNNILYIQTKKTIGVEQLKDEIEKKLKTRSGYKNYHGYFQIVKFKNREY